MDSILLESVLKALPVNFGETLASLPAPVSNLQVVGMTDTTISLTWSTPNGYGSDVDEYDLRYREKNTLPWTDILGIRALTRTLTGLTTGTTYEIQITAKNAVGDSPISQILEGSTTLVLSAPSAISDLAGTPSVGQVSLNWSPPSDGNDPIQGYRIYARLFGVGEYLQVGLSSGTSSVIGDLTDAQAYQFIVRAFNSINEGPDSNVLALTLPGLPDEVAGLSLLANNPGELAASWSAAAGNGSGVTGYRVEYRAGTSGPWIVWDTVVGTSATITGLADGTLYQVQVFAINAVGVSPTATPSSQTTQVTATVPAAISDLAEVSKTETTITVNWTASNDGGSPITGFRVEYRAGTSGGFTALPVVTDPADTIEGLTAGTAYQIKVIAINVIGDSADSNIITVTTDAAASLVFACPTSDPPVFKENLAGFAVCETSSVWRPASGGNPQIVTISDLNPSTIRAAADLTGNVIVIPLVSGISNLAGSDMTVDWNNGIFCGWAAPDIGYSIEGGTLILTPNAGNVVMSHFGARGGSAMGGESDAISIRNENGFTVMDRITATRGIDGCQDIERSNMRVDVRYSFYSRMLYKVSSNGPGNDSNQTDNGYMPDGSAHNFGGLWGSNNNVENIFGSSLFNVIDSMRQRSWLWRGEEDVMQIFDFVQNWGERAGRPIDCDHITYYGCTWRTGIDTQLRFPGAYDLAPLQSDSPFNTGSGNTAWVSECEYIRGGVPQNLSNQFDVFRSIDGGRIASGWGHHGDSGGFELMPYVIDPTILGTGQTRINNIVDAAGMKPLNNNTEDAAEKTRIKNNTSQFQVGEFQYSSASRNGSGSPITLADLGIVLDGSEHDIQSNGRTRIENILLDLKNQREVQY
ncbi:MAG: fibronectin type III domain-containing protein [Bacteroidota bacterium]